MTTSSSLLLPPRDLSSCIFAAIVRDTRGKSLNDRDRLNHFPASPLVSLTCVVEGELRLLPRDGNLESVPAAPRLPRLSVMVPQNRPVTSWSPGPVAAITIGVYPEAWIALGGDLRPDGTAPTALLAAIEEFRTESPFPRSWRTFCNVVTPRWKTARRATGGLDWAGSDRIADWSRSLVTRAALSGAGRSIRAIERRLRRSSGQTRRTLGFYAAFENLHRLSVERPDEPLAMLAGDAGYSDQSHMGRAVRRATGFSPARLNRMIESEESFWCYRLLGQRF